MNVLSKLVTALKGGVTEAGEAIVDSQALRILDQEIREAADAINNSKDSLASIIARQKLAEEKVAGLKEKITEHEGYAVKAMDKDDNTLALDVAKKIAVFETELKTLDDAAGEYAKSADQMRAAIAQAEKDVQYMKHQVDTVKATENVQKAEAAVSQRHSGTNTKLRTAMDSLERIKERQALNSAQMSAARDLANEQDDSTLDERLIKAGIKESSNAEDILARLKQKQN